MTGRQISASISEETAKLLDDYVEAYGVKKGYLVEMALLHHLQALRELPADVIIPPRLVVAQKSMREIASRLERPRPPTPAMKELMSRHAKRG